LGAFAKKDNADKLAADLKKKGYDAIIVKKVAEIN
jgi:cell division septation protein DedD